ncbi:hypothetical protein ACJMK2_024461 [Sinanodonta woodiana]|uniref:Uncharacterized protein n=1 Tax=Sinanodonta woodiana TaxID=1069815 RepID=A0ABD3XDF9_SINWO
MTVHSVANLLITLAIGFGVIIVTGFECPVAKDPVRFIGDDANSAIFMWDCFLSPNESVLGVSWFKDNTSIAIARGSDFTPKGSYAGRVKRNGTYGISLHDISQKDSGHYNILVLLSSSLNENNDVVAACQSAYLPELPAEIWKYNDFKHQLHQIDGASSLCDQQGISRLDIGLICGLVAVTIISLVFASYFICRKRLCNMRRANMQRECMQNEDMQNQDMHKKDVQNEDTSMKPEELQTFELEGRDVALGQLN